MFTKQTYCYYFWRGKRRIHSFTAPTRIARTPTFTLAYTKPHIDVVRTYRSNRPNLTCWFAHSPTSDYYLFCVCVCLSFFLKFKSVDQSGWHGFWPANSIVIFRYYRVIEQEKKSPFDLMWSTLIQFTRRKNNSDQLVQRLKANCFHHPLNRNDIIHVHAFSQFIWCTAAECVYEHFRIAFSSRTESGGG